MLYIRKEHFIGEHIDKIRERIGGLVSILELDQWSGQTEESDFTEKFDFNTEPVFLPPGTRKYSSHWMFISFKTTNTWSNK